MRQTWRDCSCRDDGIRACRIQPAPKSPEAGELHGRTGSRSISCVSVFIKTLSNFLYPSVLASCHTLYFFPSQSCWAAVGQGSVLGPVLPCGSPRAAPGRAMALLGCRQPQVCWLSKVLISNLAGSSGIELSELSSRSESVCALATVLGAAVMPEPGTTLLWCLCWEVGSGSSGSGSRLA